MCSSDGEQECRVEDKKVGKVVELGIDKAVQYSDGGMIPLAMTMAWLEVVVGSSDMAGHENSC